MHRNNFPPMARELWLTFPEAARILGMSGGSLEALLMPHSIWRDGERHVSERTVRQLYHQVTSCR